MVERLAGLVAHAGELLRHLVEAAADLGHTQARLLDHGEKLQGRHQAVAGGGVVRQDDVARLLAADVEALGPHRLEHVAITHGGAFQRQPERSEIPFQSKVAHHRGDQSVAAQVTAQVPRLGDHRHELVAIDDLAIFIDDDDAVGIAVERDADVGPHLLDLGPQRIGRGGTDLVVDVEAVGLDADGEHLGAQFPQRNRRHLVGGAIGAVDHHAQAAEIDVLGQRALGIFDVACLCRFVAMRPADVAAARQLARQVLLHQVLDVGLDLVAELVAVWAEQFDAVVVVGVVRGRDHDAEVGAQRTRQHGHGRRRHRAEEVDVHPYRGEAGRERILDQIARAARVLADDNAVAMVAAHEFEAGRHADLERQVRRQLVAIGKAPDAVGAEIFPRHAAGLPQVTSMNIPRFAVIAGGQKQAGLIYPAISRAPSPACGGRWRRSRRKGAASSTDACGRPLHHATRGPPPPQAGEES